MVISLQKNLPNRFNWLLIRKYIGLIKDIISVVGCPCMIINLCTSRRLHENKSLSEHYYNAL